ncbi:MAG TPA: peptidylprolyl isomerase [Anaeromyxobacteraceae bacterium]|nr:peptidylprolyl isomerase [Anaeromyxobacteraceae bacterium]
MSPARRILRLAPAVLLSVPLFALAAPQPDAPGASAYMKDGSRVSLFAESSEQVPVARVGGEAIAMRELADGLATTHQSHGTAAHAGKRDALVILDRLVDLRLIVIEARAMGISELPEYRARVEAYRDTTLRDVLKEGYTRPLRPDPKKVEKVYQDAVRHWRVRSLLFASEADARDFAARLKGGAKFDALASEALAAKKAHGSGQSELLPEKKMLPEVLAEVRKLSPGQVAPLIKVGTGFAVVLLEGQEYPDDPAKRAEAEWSVLQARHNEELVRQYQLLVEKYAQVDRALFKKLDIEAKKPGLEALLKDQRPLVRIQGEKPVTVGDLAQEIRGTYFHGAETGPEGKTKRALNLRKQSSLDNLLGRRLFTKEALARKVQDTPAFRYRMEDYQRSLLVSAAIERAVVPEVKVSQADVEAYYQAHKAEYTYPEFLRVEGLVFGDAGNAEATLKKLRAGTDFQFMARNADGRVDPAAAQLHFDGVLSAGELPPEVKKSLAGARSGEYRIHRDENEYHVVHVVEQIPPRPQPLEEVRADVERRAQAEKLGQAVKDWVARLRKAYPVEVYVARVGD